MIRNEERVCRKLSFFVWEIALRGGQGLVVEIGLPAVVSPVRRIYVSRSRRGGRHHRALSPRRKDLFGMTNPVVGPSIHPFIRFFFGSRATFSGRIHTYTRRRVDPRKSGSRCSARRAIDRSIDLPVCRPPSALWSRCGLVCFRETSYPLRHIYATRTKSFS